MDYNLVNQWADSKNIFSQMSYEAVNQPWVTIQAVNPFDNQIQNIDGTGSYGGEFRCKRFFIWSL